MRVSDTAMNTDKNIKNPFGGGFVKRQGLPLAFVLMLIGFSFFSDRFLTQENIRLVLRQISVLGILACGMTMVIISGNLDLSVGSTVTLTAFVTVDLLNRYNVTTAIVVSLLIGVLIGSINGVLVGYLKLNFLIVTLGMLQVIQAVVLIYSQGQYMFIPNPEASPFSFIGRGFVFGIPFPVILFGFVVLISVYLLNGTVFGRYVFSIGGNSVASKFSGIRSEGVIFTTYVIASVTAAIGGIMFASRNMQAQNTLGQGFELEVIAAVALGGTSLLGGSGSIGKSVVAVLILGFLFNAFILVGLPYYSTLIVEWIILVAAVWIDITVRRGE
jgi:ribose transport system permease protein